MKKKNPPLKKESIQDNVNINPNPDDSSNPINKEKNEQPEIFKVVKRDNTLDRKDFIKNTAVLGGLAALSSLLQNCTESQFDIERKGDNCICHVVCTCNSVQGSDTGDKKNSGDQFVSRYDKNQNCTCDTVCTCNSVCSCNTVCNCDSHSSGGGSYYGGGSYTYWYPN